jgi:phage terminase large subunit
MKTNPVFKWNYETDADIVVNQGGTSSSKTFSILQVLFLRAIEVKNIVITVCGQDIPNLKRGAIRDAKNIVATTPAIAQHVKSYNGTDKIFTFKNGSIIEFTSYDDWQDAKNGKRDYLFVNEANGVPYEIYHELQLRTRKQVFIDYNPNAAFWVHDKLVPLIKDPESPMKVVRFISNYTHNKFLDNTTKKRIEAMKSDANLWRVYGLGFTGKVKGLIFPKWEQAFKFPEDANKVCYGLDFGFSESSCALCKVGIYDKQIFAKQLVYETELANSELIEKIKRFGVGREPIYADSAEPKSIAELKKAGLNVIPINKGGDSIQFSINKINEYEAVNVIGLDFVKEISTYAYKNGKPIKQNDHLLDALRYYILGTEGRVSNKFTMF